MIFKVRRCGNVLGSVKRYKGNPVVDVLHEICTRLRPCHLSVCVGDGLWRSEEIVKISNGAFECDFYYYYCCCQLYIVVLLVVLFESIVRYHQRQHFAHPDTPKLEDGIIFHNIHRENADRDLLSCLKFFANYAFYKFGLEVSGIIGLDWCGKFVVVCCCSFTAEPR